MMSMKRNIIIALIVVILFPVSVLAALCSPSMDFSYVESEVTSGPYTGKWQYAFTLSNTSTGACTGFNIYEVDFHYAAGRDFIDSTLPTGWGDGSVDGVWFIDTDVSVATSNYIGAPPVGYDIPPTDPFNPLLSSLTGFSFKTTYKYGTFPDPELWMAEVIFENPDDSTNPIFKYQTYPLTSVPEPGTFIMVSISLFIMFIIYCRYVKGIKSIMN